MLGVKPKTGLGKAKIDKALGGLSTLRNELKSGQELNNTEIKTKQAEADKLMDSIADLEQSNRDAGECCENIEAILPKKVAEPAK